MPKTAQYQKEAYIKDPVEIAGYLEEAFPKDAAITICDLGACDGLDSIRYARMYPQATVHAFEARADNYDELLVNINLFNMEGRIIPHQACLSNAVGTATFYESAGDSKYKKDWDSGNKSSSIFQPRQHLVDQSRRSPQKPYFKPSVLMLILMKSERD
jgi:FkbM family methyltransferase